MKKFAGVVVGLMTTVVVWAQAPPSKQVEIFGQKIQYIEAGSGPTVILLHGLGGDKSNWAYTAPVLAKNYHVYVPDQIGFGESDKPLIDVSDRHSGRFSGRFLQEARHHQGDRDRKLAGWLDCGRVHARASREGRSAGAGG